MCASSNINPHTLAAWHPNSLLDTRARCTHSCEYKTRSSWSPPDQVRGRLCARCLCGCSLTCPPGLSGSSAAVCSGTACSRAEPAPAKAGGLCWWEQKSPPDAHSAHRQRSGGHVPSASWWQARFASSMLITMHRIMTGPASQFQTHFMLEEAGY